VHSQLMYGAVAHMLSLTIPAKVLANGARALPNPGTRIEETTNDVLAVSVPLTRIQKCRQSEIVGYVHDALVDEGGNLIAFERMASAWLGSIDIAQKKAWTARIFGITTKDLGANSQSGDQFFGIHASNNGKVMIFAGGLPQERWQNRRCHR
jgi:uncharacterized protein GlcG (DUF336 family)